MTSTSGWIQMVMVNDLLCSQTGVWAIAYVLACHPMSTGTPYLSNRRVCVFTHTHTTARTR